MNTHQANDRRSSRFPPGLPLLIALLVLLHSPLTARAEDPASGETDTADRTIVMKVKPGQLQYSTSSFSVPAGGSVKLVFKNNGNLNHNLIICTPGPRKLGLKVARAAWSMDNPQKNEYVPDSEHVLHASKMLRPGESDTLRFTAPEDTGEHPYVCTYPGHAQTMRGMMKVVAPDGNDTNGGGTDDSADEKQTPAKTDDPDTDPEDRKTGLYDLSYRYYQGKFDELPDFDTIDPLKSGRIENNLISLSVREKKQFFALSFSGTLVVRDPGTYRFLVNANAGARLLIDGKIVVTRDGLNPGNVAAPGTVELETGTHEFDLRYFQAKGNRVLDVSMTGPGLDGYRALNKRPFEIKPDPPRVMRVILPDAPPKAFAVGLRGNVHYCFNPGTCTVQYAWTGPFLDVGPERGFGRTRGGKTCRVLGARFRSGIRKHQPLRIGTPDAKRDTEFLGYNRGDGPPVMKYKLGDTLVHLRVSAPEMAPGLKLTYTLPSPPAPPLFFSLPDAKEFHVTATRGNRRGNTLHLPENTSEFSVTLRPKSTKDGKE